MVSCPSLQRSGVMKVKLAVLESLARSPGKFFSGTTFALHRASSSMIEWKYTNGLCRVAYWSLAAADWVVSCALGSGWAQAVPLSRAGSSPMSSM